MSQSLGLMNDNHNFRVNWLAYLVPASPELVTAQPQLVIVLIMLTDVREWHIFDLCFTRLEITLFILEGCIKFVYNYMFSIKQIFDFVTSFR